MRFSEFLFLLKLVEDMSKRLEESIFNDLSDLKGDTDINRRIDTLSRLLFYTKLHQGSLGNTDIKKFYSDVSIEEKLKQIEGIIERHREQFNNIKAEVEAKIKQNKEYEIYSSITHFFENKKRLPTGFSIA